MTSRRIDNGLRHLAPIIQARRKDQEKEGYEKPVSAPFIYHHHNKILYFFEWHTL